MFKRIFIRRKKIDPVKEYGSTKRRFANQKADQQKIHLVKRSIQQEKIYSIKEDQFGNRRFIR